MAFHDRMTQSPLRLTSWTDTRLEGNVHAAEYGALFLSIPYDKGWTVLIDGEEAETYKIFETFLAVDMPAGEHEVTLTYFPGGLKAGLAISFASILILAGLYMTKRKLELKRMEDDSEEQVANDIVNEDTTKEDI